MNKQQIEKLRAIISSRGKVGAIAQPISASEKAIEAAAQSKLVKDANERVKALYERAKKGE